MLFRSNPKKKSFSFQREGPTEKGNDSLLYSHQSNERGGKRKTREKRKKIKNVGRKKEDKSQAATNKKKRKEENAIYETIMESIPFSDLGIDSDLAKDFNSTRQKAAPSKRIRINIHLRDQRLGQSWNGSNKKHNKRLQGE